jgi:prolyl 4-hydroxylase
MRHHDHNKNMDFIAGFYPADISVVDDINKVYDDAVKNNLVVPGTIGGNNRIDISKKESLDLQLWDNDGTECTPDSLVGRYIISILDPCLKEYHKLYPHCNLISEYGPQQAFQVQEYKAGSQGFAHWHCERDNPKVCLRLFAWMTYLNDIKDSGETEFLHQNVSIKPEKGLTLIFPSDWTHTHRGLSSPTENKRIITGWLGFRE